MRYIKTAKIAHIAAVISAKYFIPSCVGNSKIRIGFVVIDKKERTKKFLPFNDFQLGILTINQTPIKHHLITLLVMVSTR